MNTISSVAPRFGTKGETAQQQGTHHQQQPNPAGSASDSFVPASTLPQSQSGHAQTAPVVNPPIQQSSETAANYVSAALQAHSNQPAIAALIQHAEAKQPEQPTSSIPTVVAQPAASSVPSLPITQAVAPNQSSTIEEKSEHPPTQPATVVKAPAGETQSTMPTLDISSGSEEPKGEKKVTFELPPKESAPSQPAEPQRAPTDTTSSTEASSTAPVEHVKKVEATAAPSNDADSKQKDSPKQDEQGLLGWIWSGITAPFRWVWNLLSGAANWVMSCFSSDKKSDEKKA